MSRAKEFFSNELDQIKDKNIRSFTEYCLDNAPPYFWVVPSSSTGKYHPPQSLGTGGLVRHTRSAVYFADILCRAYGVEGRAKDIIISAVLSHDLAKYDLPMRPHTVSNHDKISADYVFNLAKQFVSEGNILAVEDAQAICKGIAFHYGRWTTEDRRKKFSEEYSTTELIVHLADMVSAGREVSLGFLQETLIG